VLQNVACKPECTAINHLNNILALAVTRLGYREIISDMVLAFCLIVGWQFPIIGNNLFGPIERFGTRLAERKNLAIFLIAAALIFLRLGLLWLLPIPVPQVHDEFAHLLAGDTFAHGRLTNPTHPLWMFFDTIHINQFPTYMSKYPPAQGAVLAIGQLLGSPWFGVLLSVAVMCAVVLWMLQGWLPPRWALLGGVLVLARLGISSYWIEGYWGGAVSAIGGALVVGALPRIMHFGHARDAILLGVGAAILANSRPVEGLIVCAPITLFLFVWLCSKRSPPWRLMFPRLVLPFCAVMLLCGIFMGYYNWRLTGNPLLFPEPLNDRTYGIAPAFVWQKLGPRLHYGNAQFEVFYNGWARDYWLKNQINSIGRAVKHGAVVSLKFIYFFFWPELCVPLVAIPWLLGDRRVRFLIVQLGLCFLGWFSIVWFEPHYAGPAIAVVFIIIIQALRHLRRWEFKGRPVGVGLTRVVVLFAIVLAPLQQRGGTLQPPASGTPRITYRAKFNKELSGMPGKHLAIVRYGAMVDTGEWVYNAADIDHSKVVWARDIPGIDVKPLLTYFHDRDVWLVEPDANPPTMTPLKVTNDR
jgi:hypothetical protein